MKKIKSMKGYKKVNTYNEADAIKSYKNGTFSYVKKVKTRKRK